MNNILTIYIYIYIYTHTHSLSVIESQSYVLEIRVYIIYTLRHKLGPVAGVDLGISKVSEMPFPALWGKILQNSDGQKTINAYV